MNTVPFGFVSLDTCRRLVNLGQAVEEIERVYLWQAEGKILVSSPPALRAFDQENSFKSHSKMVILRPLSVAGVRVVGYRVEKDGSGPSSPDSTRFVVLMDLKSGRPLALVDEHYNYTLRTAASVAVAARHLRPSRPMLGLIGCGGVAKAVARTFSRVIPLEGIVVTSRRRSSRESFVQEMASESDLPLRAVDSVDEVASSCNLIVTATTTDSTLLHLEHLRPGMLLCALGSFELDTEIYRRADKFLVDDWEQTRVAKDMKSLIERNEISADDLYGELGDVVSGQLPGRTGSHEVIVVRTEGLASQDVALAYWSYRKAQESGLLASIPGLPD